MLEQGDGVHELVPGGEQQINVVDVLPAVKAMGEVVARIDEGLAKAAGYSDGFQPPIRAVLPSVRHRPRR